jgi:hypothetical protein
MNSNVVRIALGIAAIAAAVGLYVVLQQMEENGKSPYERMEEERLEKTDSRDGGRGGNSQGSGASGAAKPVVPAIVVRDGAPVGGVQELSFEAGERIRFDVRSDSADELHVHGYDVERALPAGRTVRVDFPASIEGLFEAELHGSGEQIAELRIEP